METASVCSEFKHTEGPLLSLPSPRSDTCSFGTDGARDCFTPTFSCATVESFVEFMFFKGLAF